MVGGHLECGKRRDVSCVPSWTGQARSTSPTTEPAFPFSFTDVPVMRSLNLLRGDQPCRG